MPPDGGDGVAPAVERGCSPGVVAGGGELLTRGLDEGDGGGGVGPETDAESGEKCRAEGGGFGLGRAVQRQVQEVGLELQEGVGASHPAVDAEARSSGRRRSAFMASIRSLIWKATPSSVARARSAIEVARVRPNRVPRVPRAPSAERPDR